MEISQPEESCDIKDKSSLAMVWYKCTGQTSQDNISLSIYLSGLLNASHGNISPTGVYLEEWQEPSERIFNN